MSKQVKYSKGFKLDALNLLQEGKSISDISINYLTIKEFNELRKFKNFFYIK